MRIEGHTDNVPIHNSQFNSNWELSTARASELLRIFVLRYNLSPARLSIAGYAEFHPAVTNDTAEGRARNRRVDIIILNPPRFALADSNGDAATPMCPTERPNISPAGNGYSFARAERLSLTANRTSRTLSSSPSKNLRFECVHAHPCR